MGDHSLRPFQPPKKKLNSFRSLTINTRKYLYPVKQSKPTSPDTEDGFCIREEWNRDMEQVCNQWWKDYMKNMDYTPPWSKKTSNTNEIFSFHSP